MANVRADTMERIPQMQLTKTERVHGIVATALYMAVLFIVWAVV